MKPKYFPILLSLILFASSCKKDSLVDPTQNNIPDMTSLSELDEATKEGVSLLFFYNTWSENCKEIRPTVEALAKDPEFASVFFGEIEFDKDKNLANYYVVRGFPTILILKDGVERHRFQGKSHSKETFEERLRGLM